MTGRRLTRDEAAEQLARLLYETQEHLDPSADGFVEWDALSERDREFYGYCVSALLARRTLLKAATDNHMIAGHANHRE